MSTRVTRQVKHELLGVALTTLQNLDRFAHLSPLAKVMRAHLIEPYEYSRDNDYLFTLKQCFEEQDHVLRDQLEGFNEELNAAIETTP